MKGTDGVILENNYLKVLVSTTSGISSITNKRSNITVPAVQSLLKYISNSSDSYIFGPSGPAVPITQKAPKSTYSNGTIFQELQQVFATGDDSSSYVKQIIRLYSLNGNIEAENFVEISFEIGPLPTQTELVTRFVTSVANGAMFYTDDNALEFVPRKYSSKYGIAGNYYPTIYASYIKDSDAQFTIVQERAHGISSQASGEVEIMLHRNPGRDLNDLTTVYPIIRVVCDSPNNSAYSVLKQTHLLNFQPMFFTALTNSIAEWSSKYSTSYKLISGDLPVQIQLMSLNALSVNSTKVIFRLHHVFAIDGNPLYTSPVNVDIGKLFLPLTITSIVETTLTGNTVIGIPGKIVTVVPKDIRTFVVEFTM